MLCPEHEQLAFYRHYLRVHFPLGSKQMSFIYVYWGSIIPPLIEAVQRAEARFGRDALERAEKEWIQRITVMWSEQPRQPVLENGLPRRPCAPFTPST